MISLATDVHTRLETVPWLSMVGSRDNLRLGIAFTYVSNRTSAEQLYLSDHWSDVKTRAQGDLTGYLSKHHYNEYGSQWNDLARKSRTILQGTAAAKVQAALVKVGLPPDMLRGILVDLNRAILEISFRRKFPKAPIFFENTLKLYEVGHLPCGWDGNLDKWPTGSLIVY